jgi:hypothetical protein
MQLRQKVREAKLNAYSCSQKEQTTTVIAPLPVNTPSDLDSPLSSTVFVALVAGDSGIFGPAGENRYVLWDGQSWTFVSRSLGLPPGLNGIEIGSFLDGNRPFHGVIDDVRIYENR